MNMAHELLFAAIISALYLGIFTIAEFWRKFGNPTQEQTRKLVHFSSGAVCLSFAYIFKSHWTVLILSLSFSLIMVVSKRMGFLKSVHSVDRRTSGGIYYPLAIYITFLIAHYFNQPHYYLIAIMILAVSDSLAALIGKRYGFKVYIVEEDNKSLEGSVIFFIVTFIIVLLGLLLLTPVGRVQCILIAVYLSLLVTGFESISLGGADNIFIPLGAIAVLINADSQEIFQIAVRIVILVLLFLFLYVLLRRTEKLGLTAIIGIALTGYAASALVALHWVFPILLGSVLFSFLDIFLEKPKSSDGVRRIRPIFYILLVSFIWILIANFFGALAYIFYAAYATNIVANLGILWQRKSRLIKNGLCTSQTPGYICHASLPVRTLFLCVILIPITALLDPLVSLWYSFIVSFAGAIVIEGIYWFIERRQRGKWKEIRFIQFTAVISMLITTIQSILSWWYYSKIN